MAQPPSGRKDTSASSVSMWNACESGIAPCRRRTADANRRDPAGLITSARRRQGGAPQYSQLIRGKRMRDTPVLTLVGAGLVGSLLAVLLARQGHRVEV